MASSRSSGRSRKDELVPPPSEGRRSSFSRRSAISTDIQTHSEVNVRRISPVFASPMKSMNSSPVLKPSTGRCKKIGEYLIGGILGSGTQGTVRKALHSKTGAFVAVKEIPLRGREIDKMLKEADILRTLDHVNIIQYIETFHVDSSIYIIFEYIENGSLAGIVRKFGVFPESLASIYIKQVIVGLEHIHGKDIVHRDIKAENILITKNGTCKLADFGLATSSILNSTNGCAGTPHWMAPELVSGDSDANKSCDIWSLGITVIELICEEAPLRHLDPLIAAFHIMEGIASPIPEEISAPLHSFLESCLAVDPTKRATASELLKHPWITRVTDVKPKDLLILQSALKTHGRVRSRSTSVQAIPILPLAEMEHIHQKKTESPLDSIVSLESQLAESSKENIALLSRADLEKRLIDTEKQARKILILSKSLCSEISEMNEHNLVEELRTARSVRAVADQSNNDLREKIVFLERHLDITDFQRASIIYPTLKWESFDTRGVLKLGKKGEKLRKRYVGLKDNFFFIFRTDACDADDPLDVIWLLDSQCNVVEGGQENTFRLTTTSSTRELYVCAAFEQAMEKWMTLLSFPNLWYDEVDVPVNITPRHTHSFSLLSTIFKRNKKLHG